MATHLGTAIILLLYIVLAEEVIPLVPVDLRMWDLVVRFPRVVLAPCWS